MTLFATLNLGTGHGQRPNKLITRLVVGKRPRMTRFGKPREFLKGRLLKLQNLVVRKGLEGSHDIVSAASGSLGKVRH